jgi:hypothetical protein
MKKVIFIQPAKLGDLIILTPAAKYYSENGYSVEWLVYDNFLSYFRAIDYVKPISFNCSLEPNGYYSNYKKRYSMAEKVEIDTSIQYFKKAREYAISQKADLILDIAWGFAGCKQENLNLIPLYSSNNKNWIEMKYNLSNVPLKERWNFVWKRDEEKEDKLLSIVRNFSLKTHGTDKFNIVHNYGKNNVHSLNLQNKIDLVPIPGFEIYDWYKVLLEAQSITCIDSALCNFVEVLPDLKEKTKYYLGSEESHYHSFMRNILFNNWLDHNKQSIVSDYLGKI